MNNHFKRLLAYSLSSCLFFTSGIIALACNSFKKTPNQTLTDLPSPDYVKYLQDTWGWNEKLYPRDPSERNYGNKWKDYASGLPTYLPFMNNDFFIYNSGIQPDPNVQTFNHSFSAYLASYGILIGVTYGLSQDHPQDGSALAFFYYPPLGIKQLNIIGDDFTWATADNSETLDIKDSTVANAFHYSIHFQGTGGTSTARDMTTITIKKYDDAVTTTNYQQAVINYDQQAGVPSWYSSYAPEPIAEGPIEMRGGDFRVDYTHQVGNIQAEDKTFFTQSNCYVERNMFAFQNVVENQTDNITSYQVVGIDSSTLTDGSVTPTSINPTAIDYVPDYIPPNPSPTQTSSSLSTGAIIGITVGSVAAIGVLVGVSYWLYRKKHFLPPNQSTK